MQLQSITGSNPLLSRLQKVSNQAGFFTVDVKTGEYNSECCSGASTPVMLKSASCSASSLLEHLDRAFGQSSLSKDISESEYTENSSENSPLQLIGTDFSETGAACNPSNTQQYQKKNVQSHDAFYSIPNEVLMLILGHVADRRIKGWSCSYLKACTLVNKKWNMCASAFLWKHVVFYQQQYYDVFQSMLMVKKSMLHQYVRFVRSIRLEDITIQTNDWQRLVDACFNLESLFIKRVVSIIPATNLNAPHATSNSTTCSAYTDLKNTNVQVLSSASIPTKSCFSLSRFQELVVSDSPQLRLSLLINLLQVSPKTKRISVSGCSFNEEDMCTMVKLCPNLVDISLGSHMSNGQIFSRSSGGDAFAGALVTTCPNLKAVDLTGIVSMTDQGFTYFLSARGKTLQKLQIRLAMQISVDALSQIGRCCAFGYLKKLTLANIPHMTDELLMSILESLLRETLEFLQLEALNISDSTVAWIGQTCTELKQLRLCGLNQPLDLTVILSGRSLTFPKLRHLIIQDTPNIFEETSLMCQHQAYTKTTNDLVSIEIDELKERLISDISEMDPSPILASPELRTPLAGILNDKPTADTTQHRRSSVPFKTVRCQIGAPYLNRLEIIGCTEISEKTLVTLICHWSQLQRFIYVGNRVSPEFRFRLSHILPKCRSDIYVLSPITPGFE
ncbi:expressed protein [Batrachochytrium dendrobatidis JAM81]|uniref:Expressed protein n=3 Tax=Batrachochytrium dendrobatidis TaxID=109871 RepID=F4P6P5_BATDJ|nr:uncharacterized protein BATDEDRAFT_90023 [Batrachochytrium dendrobatidis JAM81]EGF78851.1 expressed protein [Batrachochytrium dendrobatidis JAM81]|eukprot:XP_006680482.1 expressed protein [Batrachochytrium dendrobatidis JAM81]